MKSPGISSNVVTLKSGNETVALDLERLRKVHLILRVVIHPVRKQIIDLLNELHKMTVTELYTKLRLEQSVASQHLAVLRKTGIVKAHRNGKFIYYTLNPEKVEQIKKMIIEIDSQPVYTYI